MADNARLHMASTTAAAPATKHANTGHPQDERSGSESGPASSNAWNAMTPDATTEPDGVVPMTAGDERFMKEELHRDPADLLQRQQHNTEQLHQRQEELQQSAPGQSLEEVAAAGADTGGGPNPSAAAAAMPRPSAEQVDSNRRSEEDKNMPDPFVREETGT